MEPARLRALLARTPGLETRHFRWLVAQYPARTLQPEWLHPILAQVLPARARSWLMAPDDRLIDADMHWIDANEGAILCCLEHAFPAALRELPNAPATLYLHGTPEALTRPTLAIVGGRHPSPGALATGRDLAMGLARAGVVVIADLGDGIGRAVHEAALAACAPSIAVCPAGVDRIQPAAAAALAVRIRSRGCLLSRFPPGTTPHRYHFPLRNRLLSALGRGLLVIEAVDGDGALSAAAESRRLGRPVFAIPGSIRDPRSWAGNSLIRAGARLVQHTDDILDDLHFNNNQCVTEVLAGPGHSRPGAPPMDNKYEMLLDAAGFEPVDIDALASRTGWSGQTVASMLLLLELQGRVAPQPGGRYCRLS